MIETLKQGLLITGIGMGLVFVMIFLLWGIMALLVWLTNPREKDSDEPDADEAVDVWVTQLFDLRKVNRSGWNPVQFTKLSEIRSKILNFCFAPICRTKNPH